MKMRRWVLASAGIAWATVTSVVAMSDVEVKAMAGFVGGIAGTYFCACEDWPDSFDALKEFDDRLHDLSRRQGQKSVKRIPWKKLWNSDLEKREKGGLAIYLRVGHEKEGLFIGVKQPDCSEFNREVMAEICSESVPDEQDKE